MTGEYHGRLGIGRESFEGLEEHLERRSYEGLEYRHLPDGRRGIERGTALLEGAIVRGFPKIPRTLTLETGVPRHFDGPVAIEEKLNGYNVRVARVDGEVLAFSRSGLICPFTTRVLERRFEFDASAPFDAHPKAMLCGEVIGPESPYTAHEYPGVDSLAFRAFDWRDRETGEPLPVEERRDRLESFGIPQTRLFDVVDPDEAVAACRGIVDELDEAGREGIVMRSVDGTIQLKYTTSAGNRGDLAFAFSLPFDYGQSFVFRRLIREAFQSVERDESAERARERAAAVGEAVLLPMFETIEDVDAGERAGETHTVRADPESIDALLEHLRGQGLALEVESDRREGEDRVLTFTKVSQKTTDRTANYLAGQIVEE